jgi:RNA polymerase sigma-70 factor (ECF subfamily)
VVVKSESWQKHLSKISTIWSLLRQAHEGSAEAATLAQQLLIERYSKAVRRYLQRALGDPHAADDLTQEFALSLVRGGFRHFDPQRGRFRDYVKTALVHLIIKYRKRHRKHPHLLPAGGADLETIAAPPEDPGRAFDLIWRETLLARAWNALADAQPTYYAVLRLKADNAGMPSPQMAEHLHRQTGKPWTADGVRQTLRRARDKFAVFLVEEIAHSLHEPTLELLAEEVRDLDLWKYCGAILEQRGNGP